MASTGGSGSNRDEENSCPVSATTGPILAIGGITMANNILFHDQSFDFRVPIATLIAAAGFSAIEHLSTGFAVALAWTAFAVVLLTRVDPKVPSPIETLSAWWAQSN
jgi:hypothetical protein